MECKRCGGTGVIAEVREIEEPCPDCSPCCDGQDPSHVNCFQGNDPIGKLKAAGER